MTYRTPEDVAARLAELERRLATVERNNRLSSATIGKAVVRDDDGTDQMVVGEDPTRPRPNGDRQRVFIVRRQDTGTVALSIEYRVHPNGDVAGGIQTFGLFDNTSTGTLVQDDPGGAGLTSPKFGGFGFVPADSSQWVGTTDTNFHLITYGKNTQWHPWVELKVETITTNGCSGEIRIRAESFGSSGVVDTQPVAPGGINVVTLTGPLPWEFGVSRLYFLGVEARVTSGTGEIRAAVSYAAGQRSDA